MKRISKREIRKFIRKINKNPKVLKNYLRKKKVLKYKRQFDALNDERDALLARSRRISFELNNSTDVKEREDLQRQYYQIQEDVRWTEGKMEKVLNKMYEQAAILHKYRKQGSVTDVASDFLVNLILPGILLVLGRIASIFGIDLAKHVKKAFAFTCGCLVVCCLSCFLIMFVIATSLTGGSDTSENIEFVNEEGGFECTTLNSFGARDESVNECED